MNSEQTTRPAALEHLKPFAQLLLFLGMFLICLVFANIIGALCLNWIAGLSIFQMEALDMHNPKVLLALQVGQIGSDLIAFILPAALFVFLSSRQKAEYIYINHGSTIIVFLLAGISLVGATPIINYLHYLNGKIHFPQWIINLQEANDKLSDAFTKNQSVGALILNLFMIGALAAFAEELFFRAVLQKILIKWTKNVHIGIFLTGILFSTIHFEFMDFFGRMIMGMFLGYLYIWSKSLWVPMFVHFLNNSIIVVVSYFVDKQMISTEYDQIGSDNSQIVYVLISAVIVAVTMFFLYKMRKNDIVSTELI